MTRPIGAPTSILINVLSYRRIADRARTGRGFHSGRSPSGASITNDRPVSVQVRWTTDDDVPGTVFPSALSIGFGREQRRMTMIWRWLTCTRPESRLAQAETQRGSSGYVSVFAVRELRRAGLELPSRKSREERIIKGLKIFADDHRCGERVTLVSRLVKPLPRSPRARLTASAPLRRQSIFLAHVGDSGGLSLSLSLDLRDYY